MPMKRIILFIMAFVWLIGSPKILAAENSGLSLSPPFVDVTVGGGQTESSFYLTVGNYNRINETFNISVVDFGSLDETGGIAFLTVNGDKSERKYALASWISLEKDIVTVAAGKSEKIKVTIINKDSLTPGGHYGAVLATINTGSTGTTDEVGIRQSLATLIYVLKSGGEIPKLELKTWEFDKNIFTFPKTVQLRFGNNGNVHVVPRGTINIADSKGKTVAQGIINADSGKVLPESFRIITVPINRLNRWDWPGIYDIETNYRYEGKDTFTSVKTKMVYVGLEGALIVIIIAGVVASAVSMNLRKKRR